MSAREIGNRLRLAERTVTTHPTKIYSKLGVHGRVAAITAAARSGLVAVDLEELGGAGEDTA